MGSRYVVTGVQLGVLKGLIKHDKEDADQLLNEIIDQQFIGESTKDILEDVSQLHGMVS